MKTTSSLVAIALVTLVVTFGVGGCNNGIEGERCNPDLTHNPCNSGLTCTQPLNCPESYCCSPNSTDPYCQTGCAGGDQSVCASGGSLSPDSGLECDGGSVVPLVESD